MRRIWFVLVSLIFAAGAAGAANYTATQGVGTTFGSIVVGGVNYTQMMICDPATPGQCIGVSASGVITVSPSVGSATSARQDTGNASLATIAANTGAPIPAQSNFTTNIGAISGVVNVSPADCSLALSSGGAAQNAITAGATLHGFTIANVDSAENVWVSFTTTALANAVQSFPLIPLTSATQQGGSYTTPLGFGTSGNVSVVAATTGHKISCVKW